MYSSIFSAMEKVPTNSSIPSLLDIGVHRPERKKTKKEEYQSSLELEHLTRLKENEEIVKSDRAANLAT